MPRSGRHPLKERNLNIGEVPVNRITITTVTHIPTLEGYWAESLDVLRLFFESLFKSTDMPFDVMVFDNNSCQEVVSFMEDLKNRDQIQYLILSSKNFRKLGALNHLFQSAPGEIIAYADSDVYFLPGWLEKSLKVLEVFPDTGMVSALPTVDKLDEYLDSTLVGIENHPEIGVVRGQNLIPQEYIKAHRFSLGKSKDIYSELSNEQIQISNKGVQAFVSAQDFQFITTRAVIDEVLPLQVSQPGEEYDPIYSPVFERKINSLGYWRLSVSEYLVHHMGNHIPNLAQELGDIFPGQAWEVLELNNNKYKPHNKKITNRLLSSKKVRTVLKKIHTWSYRLLFENRT